METTSKLSEEKIELVTMRIHDQLLGIPADGVKEILSKQKLTHVPLAPDGVTGLFNLRGRIVTVINICHKLGLPLSTTEEDAIFVILENNNHLYSLMVDSIGDVLSLSKDSIQTSPSNLDEAWHKVSAGIYSLENELIVLLNNQSLFDFNSKDDSKAG